MQASDSSLEGRRDGPAGGHAGEAAQDRAAVRWDNGLGGDNPIYVFAEAETALRAGALEQGERLFQKALVATESQYGAGHPYMAVIACGLAEFYRKQGRLEEMRWLARRIVERADPDAVATANGKTLRRIAALCRMADRPGSALAFYRLALERCRAEYGNGHPKTAACLADMAACHHNLGNSTAARRLLQLATVSADNTVRRFAAEDAGKVGNIRPQAILRAAG